MGRKILIWGLMLALLSVVLGAFGAHALKNMVPADKVAIFETGVRYQFLHAIALILLSFYVHQHFSILGNHKGLGWASNYFLVGILCFSGSLYLLTFQTLCSFNYSKLVGPLTPLGGLFFILGWASWIKVVWMHKVDK
jgi:uncharacterized membrane protein YgdD (TMEM256/DUF423 family)